MGLLRSLSSGFRRKSETRNKRENTASSEDKTEVDLVPVRMEANNVEVEAPPAVCANARGMSASESESETLKSAAAAEPDAGTGKIEGTVQAESMLVRGSGESTTEQLEPVTTGLGLHELSGTDSHLTRPRTLGSQILSDLFMHIENKKIRCVEVFFTCDVDHSGSLDMLEFEEATRVMQFSHQVDDATRLAFNELDADGNGTIEIDEFMARMCRERRFRKRLAQQEIQQREKLLARDNLDLRVLAKDSQASAIEAAGKAMWSSAATSALNQWFDRTDSNTGIRTSNGKLTVDEKETRAFLAERKAKEQQKLAEAAQESVHAEEAEAEAAEAALQKEENEALEALRKAREEEETAAKAMRKAAVEQYSANKMEETARRTMQQAEDRRALYEKEKAEAEAAKADVIVQRSKLQQLMHEMHVAENGCEQAKEVLAETALKEVAASIARNKKLSESSPDSTDHDYLAEETGTDRRWSAQRDYEAAVKAYNAITDQYNAMERTLVQAEADAERESREADDAWEEFQRQLEDAEKVIPVAQQRRAAAKEAQDIAHREKQKAIDAKARAQIEVDEANAARRVAEAERAEADQARAKARQMREESDRAAACAAEERFISDEARLQFARKQATLLGRKWRQKAASKAKAREERTVRARRAAATKATSRRSVGSVITEMIAPAGRSLQVFDKSLKQIQDAAVSGKECAEGDIIQRARNLQALRQQYLSQLKPHLAAPSVVPPFEPATPRDTQVVEMPRVQTPSTPIRTSVGPHSICTTRCVSTLPQPHEADKLVTGNCLARLKTPCSVRQKSRGLSPRLRLDALSPRPSDCLTTSRQVPLPPSRPAFVPNVLPSPLAQRRLCAQETRTGRTGRDRTPKRQQVRREPMLSEATLLSALEISQRHR